MHRVSFRTACLVLITTASLGLTGCAHRVVHVDREIEVHTAAPAHHTTEFIVEREVHVHRAPVHPRPVIHHHRRHHH